jgi:hypothetical protein
MIQALHLDLHIGTVRGVHSTFISEFSVQTDGLEVAPKPWDSTMETGKILDGEAGV